MLKFFICFIILINFIHCNEDKRLIEFGLGNQKWLTPKEIVLLPQKNITFIDVTDLSSEPSSDLKNVVADYFPAQPDQKPYVRSLFQHIKMDNLIFTIEHLSSYRTRYYTSETGVEAADWIYGEVKDISDVQGGEAQITFNYFQNSFPQPSIIAKYQRQGDDPNDPNQAVIIIGAHIDSTNFGDTFAAPGADDDASGVSTLLEVMRVLYFNNFVPLENQRIEFHFYAAEEAGLLGSAAIAQNYKSNDVNVVSMVEFDMVGYVGELDVIGIVTDNTGKDINTFLKELIIAYCDIPFQETVCGYGCSDHASWYREGYIQSAFPFESLFGQHNPDIHTTRDTISNLSKDHAQEFVKLALGYLVEMGLNPKL